MPDITIFDAVAWDREMITERLRELAYLNKNLSISFVDARVEEEPETETFHYEGGLKDFVALLDGASHPLHQEIVTVFVDNSETPVDVALRYNEGYSENILTFVNNINTIEGGTHLSGFRSALTRALNAHAQKNSLLRGTKGQKVALSGADFREGLTAILSIKVAEPQFEGQQKQSLVTAR